MKPDICHLSAGSARQDGSKAWASRGKLTDAGHLLLRYTERLLALSTDAVTATRDLQEVRTGNIYLAASQTTGVYLLPKLIGAPSHFSN